MNSTGRINNLVNPSTAQDAATKAYVDTSIPIGGIIMWSGAGVTLPSNWKLCDGTTYGSVVTPDLRGRFVLSSGQGSGLSNRITGGTGGAETVTLTEAQMPYHNHSVSAWTTSDGAHTHTITDPGHWHTMANGLGIAYAGGPWYTSADSGGGGVPNTNSQYTGISINSTNSGHGHNIGASAGYAGSSNSHENMPPFYVLAFIMRVS